MIGYCHSAVLFGAEVIPIRVEAYTSAGKPKAQIVGLADSAVRESRERISAALAAADFEVPDQILINLAPADVKKAGSGLELAMAWAVLIASEQVELLESTWVFGELSLDGELKPVRGVAGIASRAALEGIRRIILPIENEAEAMLVEGIEVIGVASLNDLQLALAQPREARVRTNTQEAEEIAQPGFEDIYGQEIPKNAFEIAAAGGHNVLIVGPPGCGKSMLAERFSSLLPKLQREERLAIAQIASSIGEPIDDFLRGKRPFRTPHHIISDVGLVGGGSNLRPGEVSLAHQGVLFLDEFPEFQRRALESLRAPLESRKVTITRAIGSTTYPAAFQLIAAMNPCPCGRFGMKPVVCRCARQEVARYLKRLSQPILERIDLHVEAEPVQYKDMKYGVDPEQQFEKEELRRARVSKAITTQQSRQQGLNSSLSYQELKPYLTIEAEKTLELLASRSALSARSTVRIMRVARTVADLAQRDQIQAGDLLHARSFRALERIWNYVEAC